MKKNGYQLHDSVRYKGNLENNNVKDLPQLYSNRKNCCGCSACYVSCPVNAIEMEPDVEGFLYPVVDVDKCICCYKCILVCGFKKDQQAKGL